MVWTKFHWEGNSWRQLSLIGDETVYQSSAHKKSMSSRILCCASGGFLQHPDSNEAWKNRVCRDPNPREATEIMMRVEHLPRIHNVAALR